MVELKHVSDYVSLVLIAAGCGALGGLAAALVPTTSPGVNKPRWLTGPAVGAAAAVAILLVFPGTKDTLAVVAGEPVTTTTWSVLRVVPVALIAGWAGPKTLAVLQDRVLAAAKDQRLQATVSVAASQADRLAASGAASVREHADDEATADALAPKVKAALDSDVEAAKAAIQAAATGRIP
jgi:hypothetical protein